VRFVTEIAIWDKGMTMTLPHHGAEYYSCRSVIF
jgi:hypothetical protein